MIRLAALLLLAAAPAPAAAPLKLDGLKAEGFARLSPGALLTPAETRLVVSEVDAWKAEPLNAPKSEVLFGFPGLPGAEPRRDRPGSAVLYPMMERVDAELRRTLPAEAFKVEAAKLRLGDWGMRRFFHVDGNALTLTLPLRGPGTLLYGVDGDAVTAFPADDAATVITNQDREAETGVPATLHSAPDREGGDRILFLLKYNLASGPADLNRLQAARARIAKRLETLIAHLEGRGEDPGERTRGFATTLRW